MRPSAADEPEPDAEPAERERRTVDLERHRRRAGPRRPAERRGLDRVLGDEQARRVAHLEVQSRRLDRRVGAQVDLEPERLAGEKLRALVARRVEQPRAADLGLAGPPLAQARAPLGRIEVVGEQAPVAGDRLVRRPVVDLLAGREEDRPLAEPLDRLGVVRDEEDRAALVLERGDDAEALPLEVLVADREDLVEQQHVGLQERGDREAEPHRHPARVRADRPVDRVLELGEGDDLVEALADLGAAQALDRAVQVDVLAAAEVRVEAGPELEQRADAAVDRARCRSSA